LLGGGPAPIGDHGISDAGLHGRGTVVDPDERTLLLHNSPHLDHSGDGERVKPKPSAGELWCNFKQC